MSFNSFGKDSGPKASQVNLIPPSFPRAEESTVRWDDGRAASFQDGGARMQHQPATVLPNIGLSKLSNRASANAGSHPSKRTNPPYFSSPDEILKKSRGSADTNFTSVISADKSYVRPNQAKSPPKVFQKNLYVGGQQPHTIVSQQLQYPSSTWNNRTPSPTHDVNIPAQGVISPATIAQSRQIFNTKNADIFSQQKIFSPTSTHATVSTPYGSTSPSRYLIDYRDLDDPHSGDSPVLASGNSSSYGKSPAATGGNEKSFHSFPMLVQEGLSSVSSNNRNYPYERNSKNEDASLLKGTRSPTLPSAVSLGERRFYDRRSPAHQSVSPSPNSWQTGNISGMDKSLQFAATSKPGTPLLPSSDHDSQVHSDNLEEADLELDAKAKRLARFRDELTNPEPSPSMRNQKFPAKAQHQLMPTKKKFIVDPTVNIIGDSAHADGSSESERVVAPSSIIGSCPDMCPESERAERERKGDLDQYERQDGDRNLTNEFLAVKKYNRTAEREAGLIRPMPVLQKTMNYLLSLLRKPYDQSFLGLYNFLWDRMRAIRMDLRMQHIFNMQAIKMLEQMIRLHIIAMHELCEHMKGKGFSEGFDAHLNIEQMNKTSVELFQLYDDHRKKGISVPSEKEFRGYYALLKLDKHPGYKVEPAELSLDLAKMTPEMRQTPEVLFARDVARACRASNFIAFFRLASRATYLQACLMHPHFSKLRIQALLSLHSGLQMNQGIPISHVSKWLGIEEEEDIGEIMGCSGFSVRDFEEPYLVKENAYVDLDYEIPVKRSKLVERKRSSDMVTDVLYSSLNEPQPKEVKEIKQRKAHVMISKIPSSAKSVNSTPVQDEEMLDFSSIVSPKSSPNKLALGKNSALPRQDAEIGGGVPIVVSGSPSLDISGVITTEPRGRDSYGQPEYNPMFRNSFSRSTLPEVEVRAPGAHGVEYERKYLTLPIGIVEPMAPSFLDKHDVIEDVEQATNIEEEDTSDTEARRSCDEIKEAKLKLTLRRWKRHAEHRKELRQQKLLAANSALELLSLGPPIWTFENQPSGAGSFDIDHCMIKRHEIQERSMSVLNPADLIASELLVKNPGSKCLCWKLLLCTPDVSYGFHTGFQNTVPASCAWLKKKLLPDNNDDERDLLVSFPGVAIWRRWISVENDHEETCCISVVRQCTSEGLDNVNTGASAVLFLSAEDVPLEFQKKQLHALIMSLPSGSNLPLLILSDSNAYNLNSSILAQALALYEIKESRVAKVHIAFVRDNRMEKWNDFFSDKCLREGLKWLANDSPLQIVLSETKARDLALSHLNSITLKTLVEVDYRKASPNHCISAFNKALDLSMEDVSAAAQANPTGWPSPEIKLLDESSKEYKYASWFLPSVGWSSFSQTEQLKHAFSSSKLPILLDDLSWLAKGADTGDDFESQKQRLEGCISRYLTETSRMIDVSFARIESGMLVQRFTRLELHNNKYYIIPEWPLIFRRLYNWRLTNLSSAGLSTYILAQSCDSSQGISEEEAVSRISHVAHPSLDEQIQLVACGFSTDHLDEGQAHRPSSAPAPDHFHSATSQDNFLTRDEERHIVSTSTDNSVAQETYNERRMRHSKEDDRLNEVLNRCNVVQSRIDKILSIYF